MIFTQEVEKKVKVKVEPKFKVGDTVIWKNEVDTIFISNVSNIKISSGNIIYYIQVDRGMYYCCTEKELKLYK